LNTTLAGVREAIAEYEISRMTKELYDFLWHDFCDWYLEMIKSRLYGDEPLPVKQAVVSRALDVFDAALRLLHPVMPFITEELWQTIRMRDASATIMREQIPTPDPSMADRNVERHMAFVQNVIEAVRQIRSEMSIPPSREISVIMRISGAHPEPEVRKFEGYFKRLARVTSLSFISGTGRPGVAAGAVVDGEEFFVPLTGLIDVDVEKRRLQKEIDRITGVLSGIRSKLGNPAFTERAPEEIVAREREKQASFETNLAKLSRNLAELSGTGTSAGRTS
jgi:valyl-tRNA synthetase